jgi:uncharacterized repeat protein (TIGR01451 family)
VDKKAPTITLTSPASSGSYQLKALVNASYACGDGGSGVATCQGTVASSSAIDTGSTGNKTFSVTSTDAVGNQSSVSVNYSVVSGGGGGSGSADLSLASTAPSKATQGSLLTYTITVTNLGKSTAMGIIISDALPLGTVFASATTTQGTIAAPPVDSTGTVTVNIASLASSAGATISLAVTVTASAGTILSDTAAVSATTQDLNSANNNATQKTTVNKK